MTDIRFRDLIARVYECENTRSNDDHGVPCAKHASTECVTTRYYAIERGTRQLETLIASHPIYECLGDDLADRKLLLAECQRTV